MAEQQLEDEAQTMPATMPAQSSKGFLPADPERVKRFCESLAKSSLVPQDFRGHADNVFVAVQLGLELGLAPMQALQSIAVINGRPSLWGDGMVALVTSHPDFEDMEESITGSWTDKTMVARCTIHRRGRSPVVSEFTYEDAELAGSTRKKGPWQTHPKRMMQWRARGFAMRDAFADALRGLRLRDEWEDVPPPQEKEVRVEQPEQRHQSQGERLAAKLEDQTAAPGERRDAPASGGTTQGGRPTPDMDTARLEAFATLKRDIAQMQSAETQDVLSIGNLIAAADDLTDEQRAILHDALHERVKELKA